jgi:formate dehydrogenase subunit beta
MENKLREIAREFLQRGEAQCFIGYEQVAEGSVRPAFIRAPEEVTRLVWNRECYPNLTAYLPKFHKAGGIVGIAVKGCDARALRELIRAGQVERSKVFIVGLPCTGLKAPEGDGIAERCFGSIFPKDFQYDVVLGPMNTPDLPPRVEDEVLSGLSPEERFSFWEKEIEKCISCDLCRKICYACFLSQCPRPPPGWPMHRVR